MTKYERVTYRTGKKSTSVYLENPREVNGHLVGREVDNEGMIKDPDKQYLAEHGAEAGQKIHIVGLEHVTKRVPHKMNNTYGTLEPEADRGQ